MAQVILDLPKIVHANYSVDFSAMCWCLNQLTAFHIQWLGISPPDRMDKGGYYAVFYTGVMPDAKAIAKLAAADERFKE